MKCLLLVAGYATRLYPLTKDLPKSLLPVGGKTILEHLFEKIAQVPAIDEVILVSNARFAPHFRSFLVSRSDPFRIRVVDDGTHDNESRLGAIGDMELAIRECGIDDDLLVLAGDNLFDFSLADFAAFFGEVGTDCITAHEESSLEALRRTGVAVLDGSGRVLSFAEKPRDPQSSWAVPPFYIYGRKTLPLVTRYLEEGENPDAPGQFVRWLVGRAAVHAFRFAGQRHDIGSLESYRAAQALFTGT